MISPDSVPKYTFHTEVVTYTEAQTRCLRNGQYLAMPKSEAEHLALLHAKREQNHAGHVWLGIDDARKEGHWVYNDGSEVKNWAKWGTDQPDSHNSKVDCVVLIGNFWDDVQCGPFQNFSVSYVCQEDVKGMSCLINK